MRPVVIAAGGTGGHIYPGLALADALRAARPDVPLVFVGTRRGLEGTLIPKAGHRLEYLDMIPFASSIGWRRFLLPAALVRAALQARRLLRREGAGVAVGMGGYVSVPLVLGARAARVPSLIHESGAIPGKANRLSARFTRNIALAFERAVPCFKGRTTRVVGMPLGAGIAGFDGALLRSEARVALDVPEGVTLVLVVGGSQGSVRLNQVAAGLAARWKDRTDVRIIIKAGPAHVEDVTRALKESGGDAVATAVDYLDRMDHAYAAADLALTRAGASTVAELAITGVPAVLVPFPFATEDHQTINAAVLADVGAALVVADDRAEEDVGPLVEELLAEPGRLVAMSDAARVAARPKAAEELAAWVLELADG